MEKMPEAEIETRLQQFPGWIRTDGKWLAKKYRFRQFMDGISFVRAVAEAAERLNHHPMIAIDYKVVTLRVTTWSAGGITELDFKLMELCDRLFAQMVDGKS